MKVSEGQIYNLMDTNGRRNDVVEALQGYLAILDDVFNGKGLVWDCMPRSTCQFEFYRQAISLSPDVFKKHDKFDALLKKLDKFPELKNAVLSNDIEWLRKKSSGYEKKMFKELFDKGIEDRARHYTSNLVKLGFVGGERNISDVGKILLGKSNLHKDVMEKLLPLSGTNIVYLRQLIKLKIFTDDGDYFYSPFCLALYLLLKYERVSWKKFSEIIQGLTPYHSINDIDAFENSYSIDGILGEIKVPNAVKTGTMMDENLFCSVFRNGKSKNVVNDYYCFYKALYKYNSSRSDKDYKSLVTCYGNLKEIIKKAFNFGEDMFSTSDGRRCLSRQEFEKKERTLLGEKLNENLFIRFAKSKKVDSIYEYSDTTRRIFNATGLIKFDKGYVELAYRELCAKLFDFAKIRDRIFGQIDEENNDEYECYDDYECGVNSYFCSVNSLTEILDVHEDELQNKEKQLVDEFDVQNVDEIPQLIENQKKICFENFVRTEYPRENVKEILSLFSDRSNDERIKERVCPDATVPTIYEYMVGLAWYYFSGEKIDLLSSFNLTLSANFEPLSHAGGGMGDIVIYEDDKVVMLEATLMDSNSQKRGEWEPVLRHAVNLKIEEEENKNRDVTTFFIAETFDANTINIWKAVSTVPLQSSADRTKFTNNVIIMPISSCELLHLMDKYESYDQCISEIRGHFESEGQNFDMEWRDKIVANL